MMSSILKSISEVPLSRTAFISADRNLTYSDIKRIHDENLETISTLSGSCVVINGRKRAEFVLLLSILDGHASRIVFLPEDIDSSLSDQFYDETEANYEVYLEHDTLKYKIIKEQTFNEENKIFATEWIVPTSGTTNIPKLVAHTYDSLTRTAQSNIEVGENYRWGLVFDVYRFSGIQVFLQSIISGSTLIISELNDSMSQILNLLADNNSNALSATPSFWRKVLMSKEVENLDLNRITLGGEIADANVLSALKRKFPEAKLSHIYASTEVGVGFSVKDEMAGFPIDFIDNGIGTIKLKIDNDNLLWINPGTRTQKYIAREDMYDQDGYINTGDLVEKKEGRIYFLGRQSGAINVGGNKVQPEEVESMLLSSGKVSAAYVYSKNNPMVGSLVCADVVPIDHEIDKKILKKEILSYCRGTLEGFKVPAILKIVDELEITNSGKLKRK